MVLTPTSRQFRVFIDSTVFFAACASALGASRLLLDKGFSGLFQLCFSTLVLLETQENLAAKRPQALAQFDSYRAKIDSITDPPVDLVQRAMRIVVAKDAPIIAAAASADAQYLLTLDQRHILAQASAIASEYGLSLIHI